ncbi:MAG: hypothetical protein IKQ44_05305 [Lachnospiraceae bacterium]|nr:hypothetical protein [Lachnospiraceae bacterium]
MITGIISTMKQFGINGRYIKYIFIGAVVILTLFRIYLGVNIPLFLQGDARYDDYLMVQYADSISSGNWLGNYCNITLVKTCSMSLMLVLGHFCGISYSMMLTVLYILSVLAISVSFGKLSDNRYIGIICYIVLLFSPIMFHKENVQKVYRGGYIVIFSMFVTAAVVGLFAFCKEKISRMVIWSIIGSLALPIFWYMKEDSIWLLPFVVTGIAITIICLALDKKTQNKSLRIVICTLPLVSLILCILIYRGINKKYYDIYTDNDRSNTYFAEVIHDLLKMENAGDEDSWLTRESLVNALSSSEAFASIGWEVLSVYDMRAGKDGNVVGDYFIWGLRESAGVAGIYDNGAKESEGYWKTIHDELTKAYEEGKLTEDDNAIFLSPVTRGAALEEISNYYRNNLRNTLKQILIYEFNDLELLESVGDADRISIMAVYAGNNYISETNYDEVAIQRYEKVVGIANNMIDIFERSARIVLKVSVIGYIAFILTGIIYRRQGVIRLDDIRLLTVCLGLGLTSLILIMAVLWFCNFLTDYKIYDYCSAAIPMIQILEIIGIYYFIRTIYMYIKNVSLKRCKKA